MFAKNKKNKSVVLLIVAAFWVGYVFLSAVQFYFNVEKAMQKEITKRQIQLQYVQENYLPLVLNENFPLLKERLEQSRALEMIDFYIIQNGKKDVVEWYNNFNNLDGINTEYTRFNQILEGNDLALRSVKVGEYTFTVGVFQDKNELMWRTAWLLKNFIIRDLVLVTLMVAFVAYLFLKDIINLSKALSSRDRTDIANIKTNSAEAETLVKASMGLEGERVRLEKLSEVYGETVGPAILHELRSGRPAPYNFDATLCRVDLNGYTQMFLEKDNKYLIEILNKYFARAREVIQRYDGLIYQFVGDEIVFQFKDDMSPELSTEALAAGCMRDLFAEAEVIEKNLPTDANHYFKLKGSFARGTMRFTQLDEGHALSGLPLIESVRLLSLVDDKTHQVLTFFQEASTNTDGLAFIFDRKTNQLKGFKEESLICRSRDFNSIEWIFESNLWERLAYFRSDEHMLFILKKVRLMAVTRRDDDLVRMLSALRHHKFSQTIHEVSKESEITLNSFIKGEEEGLLSPKALSAFISLLGRIIPSNLWSPLLQDSIAKMLEHKDPRVQANAIMVLGQHGYPARKLWENMFSKNNRVAADTIVEVAKQQLNSDVWDALHRLINSSQASYQRSGQYALENILKHYAELDPVYLKTNPILIKMQSHKSKAA